MKQAIIKLETLTCPSCMQKIEKGLQALTGVDKSSVTVRFNASKVYLIYDENQLSIENIKDAIAQLGYAVDSARVKAVEFN